jgi:zinc transport system permease protein
MGELLEALGMPFMQRALLAGVISAAVAGYFGVFIVQRRMAFMGTGLAHAAFGGVGLALLMEQEPLVVALPFTVAVAVLITWVRERSSLGVDTVIGIFFALTMALGIVFIAQLKSYATDAFALLFGSLLGISRFDIWAVLVVLVLALASLPLWPRWAAATFDRESAIAERLPVRRDDYTLNILLALVIVVAAKVVGIVLVSAFLVIPAAAARLITARFAQMTMVSVALGVLTAVAGLAASYLLDWPSGATVILVQCAGFGIIFALAQLFRR